MKLKWPFVRSKRFWALHEANAKLHENHEELCAHVDRMHHDHDHEIRKLHAELHHARKAIYNTKAMKLYEELLLNRKGLQPSAALMDITAMSEEARAAMARATGINNAEMGLRPTPEPSDD